MFTPAPCPSTNGPGKETHTVRGSDEWREMLLVARSASGIRWGSYSNPLNLFSIVQDVMGQPPASDFRNKDLPPSQRPARWRARQEHSDKVQL